MPFKPDPKPARRRRRRIRVENREAIRRLHRARRECCVCGGPASNAHHVIRKGSPYFGDDVPENLAPICGSGSSRCHGAVHGSPYVDEFGHRWTQAEANEKIGLWLQLDPARLDYAVGKAGAEYVERTFKVRVSGHRPQDSLS